MADPADIKCPKCGEPLGLKLTARLMNESRMSFVLKPHPGELLSARNVGGIIEQMEKLLVAIGKEMGAKTAVLVEGITSEEGAITVNLLLTRLGKEIIQRAKQLETV